MMTGINNILFTSIGKMELDDQPDISVLHGHVFMRCFVDTLLMQGDILLILDAIYKARCGLASFPSPFHINIYNSPFNINIYKVFRKITIYKRIATASNR